MANTLSPLFSASILMDKLFTKQFFMTEIILNYRMILPKSWQEFV